MPTSATPRLTSPRRKRKQPATRTGRGRNVPGILTQLPEGSNIPAIPNVGHTTPAGRSAFRSRDIADIIGGAVKSNRRSMETGEPGVTLVGPRNAGIYTPEQQSAMTAGAAERYGLPNTATFDDIQSARRTSLRPSLKPLADRQAMVTSRGVERADARQSRMAGVSPQHQALLRSLGSGEGEGSNLALLAALGMDPRALSAMAGVEAAKAEASARRDVAKTGAGATVKAADTVAKAQRHATDTRAKTQIGITKTETESKEKLAEKQTQTQLTLTDQASTLQRELQAGKITQEQFSANLGAAIERDKIKSKEGIAERELKATQNATYQELLGLWQTTKSKYMTSPDIAELSTEQQAIKSELYDQMDPMPQSPVPQLTSQQPPNTPSPSGPSLIPPPGAPAQQPDIPPSSTPQLIPPGGEHTLAGGQNTKLEIARFEEPGIWPNGQLYGVTNNASAGNIGEKVFAVLSRGGVIPETDIALLRQYITAKLQEDPEYLDRPGFFSFASEGHIDIVRAIMRGDDLSQVTEEWVGGAFGTPKIRQQASGLTEKGFRMPKDWRQPYPQPQIYP